MKHLKTLFVFMLTLLLSIGQMWATTINVPTTTLDLSEPTIITTEGNWKEASCYYLDDEVLVLSGYASYQNVNKQTWIKYASTGSNNATWNALAPFKGSSYYTTEKYATLQAGRYTAYLVTNCDSVWVYCKNNSTSKYFVLNIYDVTNSTATTIDDSKETATYALKNTSTTAEMVLKQELDASKKYLVVTAGVGSSNSRVFEVAFFRPGSTEPTVFFASVLV